MHVMNGEEKVVDISMVGMMNGEEEKVVEEVSRGRELALQLRRLLLLKNQDPKDDLKKEHLAGKILDSFWNSLFILNNISQHHHQDHHHERISISPNSSGSALQITTALPLPEAAPTPTPTAAGRGRRYKRRKPSGSDIRKREHSTTYCDDGHAWRKYGQKNIHDTKFPRSYYRCTHKYDQGCKATKHIEMIQQNPAKYRSAYYGHHTCTTPKNHLQFLLESAHHHHHHQTNNNDNIISFRNNINNSTVMLSFGSPISTFQLPKSTSSMIFSPTVQVEDHLMVNKYRDDVDDEQGVQQIGQQPADSPEYLQPSCFDIDRDDFIDDIDFTDLQDFIFS